MPDLTRDEATRLLTGLRARRDTAIDAGDIDEVARLDDQIRKTEAILNASTPRGSSGPVPNGPRRGKGDEPKDHKTRNIILAVVAVFLACGICGNLIEGDTTQEEVVPAPTTPVDSAATAEADSIAQAEAAELARFGPAPTLSAWDGGSRGVQRYLERVARDPESVEVENCTQPIRSDLASAATDTDLPDGWVTVCEWAARNGFGGMNRTRNTFVLRDVDRLETVVWTDMQ